MQTGVEPDTNLCLERNQLCGSHNTFCTVFLPMCCQGTAVYGATHLADLTEEEFKENYLGFKRSEIECHQRAETFVCLQTLLVAAGQEGTIRQRSTGRRPRSQTWSCPSLLTGGNMARSRMSRIRCRPFSHFPRIYIEVLHCQREGRFL